MNQILRILRRCLLCKISSVPSMSDTNLTWTHFVLKLVIFCVFFSPLSVLEKKHFKAKSKVHVSTLKSHPTLCQVATAPALKSYPTLCQVSEYTYLDSSGVCTSMDLPIHVYVVCIYVQVPTWLKLIKCIMCTKNKLSLLFVSMECV